MKSASPFEALKVNLRQSLLIGCKPTVLLLSWFSVNLGFVTDFNPRSGLMFDTFRDKHLVINDCNLMAVHVRL